MHNPVKMKFKKRKEERNKHASVAKNIKRNV